MKNNITFILCTKNSIETIEKCLESIKNYKVILVDKDSNDGTLDIAKKYKNIKIINQKGKGLANARNLGLQYVKTKFVCMLGSDNVFMEYPLLMDQIEKGKLFCNWSGLGFRTEIFFPKTYLDKCVDFWWKNKIFVGERKVVGTPVIYETEILKQFGYDENVTHSDDTILGEKLFIAGYKQGYSPYFVFDITKNNLKNIFDRWTRYGISDYEFYKNNSKNWKLKRKIQSWLHPLKTEWVGFNLFYFPFYLLIVSIRYFGWIKRVF